MHAKAESYIANGYQRLLTFRKFPAADFSWFGQAPANKIPDCLRPDGIFRRWSEKVYEVDAKVIQRTQQWLASEQQL